MPSHFPSAGSKVRRGLDALLLGAGCMLAAGCAHHRADQYSYAPPYAPPVYPQPQMAAAGVTTPPTVVVPAVGVPAAAMVAGVPQSAPQAMDGVVQAVGGECPPCAAGGVATSSFVVGEGQTPPCPPGP